MWLTVGSGGGILWHMAATKVVGRVAKPKARKESVRKGESVGKGESAVGRRERLLKLAAKNRPPQSWYDETDDPTKPKAVKKR